MLWIYPQICKICRWIYPPTYKIGSGYIHSLQVDISTHFKWIYPYIGGYIHVLVKWTGGYIHVLVKWAGGYIHQYVDISTYI